jgi:hypothetical protein
MPCLQAVRLELMWTAGIISPLHRITLSYFALLNGNTEHVYVMCAQYDT